MNIRPRLKGKKVLTVVIPFLVAMALVFIPAYAKAAHITGFTAGQAVRASDEVSVEPDGPGETGSGVQVLVKSNLPDNEKIAKYTIDFSGGDLSWSDVTVNDLGCDWPNHKSFIHISNFPTHGIVGSTFTLYVPKDTTASVRICEGATNINDVYEGCYPDLVAHHEFVLDSSNSYTYTYDSHTIQAIEDDGYWKVTGVSGTGGEAFGEEDGEAVPEFTTITFIIAAVAGFGIYLLIRRRNSRLEKEASKEE